MAFLLYRTTNHKYLSPTMATILLLFLQPLFVGRSRIIFVKVFPGSEILPVVRVESWQPLIVMVVKDKPVAQVNKFLLRNHEKRTPNGDHEAQISTDWKISKVEHIKYTKNVDKFETNPQDFAVVEICIFLTHVCNVKHNRNFERQCTNRSSLAQLAGGNKLFYLFLKLNKFQKHGEGWEKNLDFLLLNIILTIFHLLWDKKG